LAPKQYRKVAWVVVTLQEAYSAIIPYFLLTSFLALTVTLLRYFHFSWGEITPESLTPLLDSMDLFSSVVVTITISYFFAKRLEVSPIISVTLGVATYVTVMVLEESTVPFLFGYTHGFVIQTLFVPVLGIVFMKLFFPWLNLRIPLEDQNIHIYRLFNYIFVFGAAYVATVVLYEGIDEFADWLLEYLQSHFDWELPTAVALGIRDLGVQFFWFFGIHGDYTVNAITGSEFLGREIFPHLTVEEFNRLFVTLGGAGSGMALLIALLVYAKRGIVRTVARISIPFVLFNINTLLIYAVVVFNRHLLVPFLLLPLLNLIISYGVLDGLGLVFDPQATLTWTTPIFLDSYLKSGGDWRALVLQGGLLVIDTLVYMHFVRQYLLAQSHTVQMTTLQRRLDLPYALRARQNIHSFVAHKNIITSNAKLDQVIASIRPEKMRIYFQPKIDMERGRCEHFEVLLRYRYEDRVALPDFLDLIEEAGLAPTIDAWVAKELATILEEWKRERRFTPTVSINLHPDTLANPSAVESIVKYLKGKKVIVEIVERSFLEGTEALEGVNRLRLEGFGISVDDYGVGYSNLESILDHEIDELKIDKGVIDRIEEEKGEAVCESIISLSKKLGISVVAEGVETERQIELLRRMQVEYIQGFFFSPALPSHQAYTYAKGFDLQHYLKWSDAKRA